MQQKGDQSEEILHHYTYAMSAKMPSRLCVGCLDLLLRTGNTSLLDLVLLRKCTTMLGIITQINFTNQPMGSLKKGDLGVLSLPTLPHTYTRDKSRAILPGWQ